MVDRQTIIERTINLENLLCSLITVYFFPGPNVNFNFMHTVLYDPYATSGYKVSLFHKCYPAVNNRDIERLRRIFNIRNLFAHAGLYVMAVADPDSVGYVDPKDRNKHLDFDALASEFDEKIEECETVLGELIGDSGLVMTANPSSS